jgi:hypothetical protein
MTDLFCLINKFFNKSSRLMRFFLLILTVTLLNSLNLSAQTGSISGKIIDSQTGEELIGANILIEGTTLGAATDLYGSYIISNVEAGSHTLTATMVGYARLTISDVIVKSNEVLKLDIILTSEAIEIEEVIVTARMLQDNEASLLKLRQKSNSISDAISSELISRSGSSNAADAMTKVIGASVVGGKYVYVRGLGERYSSTHLNGTELPSADPDKKSFNLDLFPSGILDNIVTIKSFTPDKPGNFSGGIVDIATKSYPEKFTIKLSSTSSYNSAATFNNNFLTYNGGGKDWLGMDDGTRKIPDIFSNPDLIIPSLQTARTNSEQAMLLDEISKSFIPQMSPGVKSAPLNQSYSLSIGDQTDFLGMPVGL